MRFLYDYWKLVFIWCGIVNLKCIEAELYTALVELEGLLKTETVLMDTLKNYVAVQEQKLEFIKKQIARYAKEHEKADKDATEYLANPINAYLLVKRLTTDWKATENQIKEDVYREMIDNITSSEDLKFPTEEDLNGAAVALTRLQDTYDLDTESLAEGKLNGVKYSTQLSSDDCFELGRQSYNNQDYYHTILWMREALRKYEREDTDLTTFKWEILEYLAYSLYMEGELQSAYDLTKELLTILPNHPRAKGNLEYYRRELERKDEEDASERKKGDDGDIDENEVAPSEQQQVPRFNVRRKKTVYDTDEYTKYELLCRKALQLPAHISSKLRCRYVHRNNPYLLIAPLKEEEAYPDPRIVLYREAIYENEMEIVKSKAQPRLRRATVQNHKTGDLEVANYRISKSAWLKEEEHPAIKTIRQRVADMTSLTVETAEELQVVNYGLGGHYEPHYDFARKEEINAFKSLLTGNRIATVLFYMSDVAQGGATVFPSINLALWPEKGSAAFWLNLYSSGAGNFLTRHAACPVLQGSKWVSNVWLHESGQEFLRPCDPADASTTL